MSIMDSDGQRTTKRCMKMTRKQAAVLVEFMEAHRDFAVGRFDSFRRKSLMMKMWKELKALLDMNGAPKTLEQWRRAWKDYRGKIRAKNARLLGERSAGVEGTSPQLSNLEARVLAIIGPSAAAAPQKPALTKESSQTDRTRCITTVEETPEIIPVTEIPVFRLQPSTPTTAKSIIKPQQAVASQKNSASQPTGSGRSKVVITDDRLDDILLSILESFRAESLEFMKVIANGVTSIAEGQRDNLIVQKERLEFQRELLKLERKREENQTKMEKMLMDVVECQRRMACAQEQRTFFTLDDARQEV